MRARSPDRASAHVVVIGKPAFMLGLDALTAGERSYGDLCGPGAKGKPGDVRLSFANVSEVAGNGRIETEGVGETG